MADQPLSRRDFIRLSSSAVALGVLPNKIMEPSLNVALIGAGQQGLRLLQALWDLPSRVRVVGVCDISETALNHVAQLAQAPLRLTQDLEEVLQWQDVQAVLIATPDFSHTPIALAALTAGKAVYLEPPLARTVAEMQILQRSAKQSIYSGEFMGQHPRYAIAAQLIRSGMLGKINRVQITVHTPSRYFDAAFLARWQQSEESSYGVVFAHLAQKLSLVQQILGVQKPTHITVHGGVYVTARKDTNPDTLYALLDYSEGFIVSFAALVGDPAQDIFTLHGTHGTLDLQHGQLSADYAVSKPIPEMFAQQATRQLQLADQHHPDLLAAHLSNWITNVNHSWAGWEQAKHIVGMTELANRIYRNKLRQ